MLLKLYRWLNKDKHVLIFDRNYLPEDGDTITVNNKTAVFGQDPDIYVTDEEGMSKVDFEEEYRLKYNKEALLVTVQQGKGLYRL